MKTAVRKKACFDQTYPMIRFAPCHPSNSNFYEIFFIKVPFLSSKIWRDKTEVDGMGFWILVQNNQISGRISGPTLRRNKNKSIFHKCKNPKTTMWCKLYSTKLIQLLISVFVFRYFQSVTSNRMLMIKIFGVLIFFFLLFVIFMA